MALVGENHPAWKGGRVVTKKGYVLVTRKGHPRADKKSGYVFEHIVTMEENLGRYLYPGENVHHKNGVRDDNRIENLELWVTMQPTGQRAKDLVKWAKEILAKYNDPKIVGS